MSSCTATTTTDRDKISFNRKMSFVGASPSLTNQRITTVFDRFNVPVDVHSAVDIFLFNYQDKGPNETTWPLIGRSLSAKFNSPVLTIVIAIVRVVFVLSFSPSSVLIVKNVVSFIVVHIIDERTFKCQCQTEQQCSSS
jgi:RsiW-degrading membrane proteinase PrsW (M82 family)